MRDGEGGSMEKASVVGSTSNADAARRGRRNRCFNNIMTACRMHEARRLVKLASKWRAGIIQSDIKKSRNLVPEGRKEVRAESKARGHYYYSSIIVPKQP